MSVNVNFNQPQLPPVQPIAQTNAGVVPASSGAVPGVPPAQTGSDIFETNRTRPARDVDMAAINEAIRQGEQQVEAFRRLVERLLGQQGQTWVNSSGETMVYIDEATRVRAAEEIAEGGYFSVEAVTDRLLGFARAFAGDDPERIELMRTAFLRGFEAAEAQWGGRLPDISHDTFAAVMAGFDEWLAGINAAQQD